MDVNFMKMHNPTNASPEFAGRTHLGDYSDSRYGTGLSCRPDPRCVRAEAPNTVVILTSDNGAWRCVIPMPERALSGEKGSAYEVPSACCPHVVAGQDSTGVQYGEMMSHIDCWSTLATMVGLKAPATGEMKDNKGKPIYFDSIDNSAYILGKAEHSARKSWILYQNGESSTRSRDIGGDPKEPG